MTISVLVIDSPHPHAAYDPSGIVASMITFSESGSYQTEMVPLSVVDCVHVGSEGVGAGVGVVPQVPSLERV